MNLSHSRSLISNLWKGNGSRMAVSKSRLLLSLMVGITAASFASIIIRLAQGAGMPSLAIAAWRLIFTSMILLPYAWLRRRDEILDLSVRNGG